MQFIKTVRDHDLASTETMMFSTDGYLVASDLLIDIGADGTNDRREIKGFSYDAAGRLASNNTAYDNDANGTVDFQDSAAFSYDALGRLSLKEVASPDGNGDGNPDTLMAQTFSYDGNGRVVTDHSQWYFDGWQSPSDYRTVSTTYTAAGNIDVETIDDPSFYDFVVGSDFEYDAQNRLVSVARLDPFVYGDESYHVTETWSYAPDGSVTYSNVTGQTEWGFFASLTTKLTYDTATKTSELIEGKDANGDVVFRAKEEIWRNYFGEETDILTSYDGNLDGSFTPGSKSNYMDSRDRTKMKYADIFGDSDRELVFQSTDIGLDKVIDYHMEITPIDPLLA